MVFIHSFEIRVNERFLNFYFLQSKMKLMFKSMVFINIIVYLYQTVLIFKNMSNQQEINDLLNDSWDQSQSKSKITAKQKTVLKQTKPNIPQPNYQESNSYGQDFQDYQQSRRTQSIQQSYSESLPTKPNNKNKQKEKQKNKQLASIKQQPSGMNKKPEVSKASQNYIKPALQLHSEHKFNKKKPLAGTGTTDKIYLPHNYARLQQRQKELLLTTLTEQNKKLKAELSEQVKSLQKFEAKYNILLQQKTENHSTAKEIALERQVANLRARLEQMSNLHKITEQRQKYKTKLGKNPGNFIPEEESNRREAELLQLIDKLKRRLLESDQNMGVLQKKLNQGVQYNDQLHRKIKRVEQLEYKIEKMVEQAETDRGYIDILKQKIKQLEKQMEQQKSKYRKLEVQMKRLQMSSLTHNDLLKELEQVRREKELLEKSLKDISSAMMSNVRKNYQNLPKNKIEDSDQLLRANK